MRSASFTKPSSCLKKRRKKKTRPHSFNICVVSQLNIFSYSHNNWWKNIFKFRRPLRSKNLFPKISDYLVFYLMQTKGRRPAAFLNFVTATVHNKTNNTICCFFFLFFTLRRPVGTFNLCITWNYLGFLSVYRAITGIVMKLLTDGASLKSYKHLDCVPRIIHKFCSLMRSNIWAFQ